MISATGLGGVNWNNTISGVVDSTVAACLLSATGAAVATGAAMEPAGETRSEEEEVLSVPADAVKVLGALVAPILVRDPGRYPSERLLADAETGGGEPGKDARNPTGLRTGPIDRGDTGDRGEIPDIPPGGDLILLGMAPELGAM